MSNKLEQLYTNPSNPGAYSGFNAFKRLLKEKKIKINDDKIKRFLQKKESYSLHRPRRDNFPTKKVIVGGIRDTFQIDLVDMQKLADENNGYRYILTCIDVFKKKGYAVPLKNKNQKSTTEAFARIIKIDKPKRVQADKGNIDYLFIIKYIKLNVHFNKVLSFLMELLKNFSKKIALFFTQQTQIKRPVLMKDLIEQ